MRRMHLMWLSVVLIAPAWGGAVLYTNGPINGAYGGDNFDSTSYISDSFVLSTPGTIGGVSNIGVWVYGGDTPLTVDWTISTAPDGGGTVEGSASGVSFTNTFFTSSYGYDIYNSSFTVSDLSLAAGTYYLELTNATSAQSGPVYWDINSGPSAADFDGESVPSDSFEIDGASSATPEPASVMLLGAGLAAFAGMKRLKTRR